MRRGCGRRSRLARPDSRTPDPERLLVEHIAYVRLGEELVAAKAAGVIDADAGRRDGIEAQRSARRVVVAHDTRRCEVAGIGHDAPQIDRARLVVVPRAVVLLE